MRKLRKKFSFEIRKAEQIIFCREETRKIISENPASTYVEKANKSKSIKV